MPDSTSVAALPDGYEQYLGYADGNWPTRNALRARFPAARTVILTVTGLTQEADGIDCEPGNPNAKASASWLTRKLAWEPGSRPIAYADLETDGYSILDIVADLAYLGVARSSIRLLTAHWTHSPHICGPASCGALPFDADGTQWTNTFAPAVDMSMLRDDFFDTWQEAMMRMLPTLKQGDTGPMVRTVQGLCISRAFPVAVDGVLGPLTAEAVRQVQATGGLVQDAIIGPQTWPVLMGLG